jgi:hypothetical protein
LEGIIQRLGISITFCKYRVFLEVSIFVSTLE